MAKATEVVLGELHRQLAETLTEACKPIEVVEDGGVIQKIMPAPAYLGAAIAFLKNNNITADPSTNKELQELNEALRNRGRKRLTATELEAAAADFAKSHGGDFMQ